MFRGCYVSDSLPGAGAADEFFGTKCTGGRSSTATSVASSEHSFIDETQQGMGGGTYNEYSNPR